MLRAFSETSGDEWWPESNEVILARAADLPTGSPLRLEIATAELIGEEYWSRLQVLDQGFHTDQYLAALADQVLDELRTAVRDGGGWQALWRMLQGISAMTPPFQGETLRRDPDPAVREALEAARTTLAAAGIAPAWPTETLRAEPAGDPLVVADLYGSRFALLAPFAWGHADHHWYCWDIDRCGSDMIVAAGVFSSPDEALAEWRGAVGPVAAPDTAAPVACDADLAQELLATLVHSGYLPLPLMGNESREVIVEIFRMRQRARALCGPPARQGASWTPADLDPLIEDFAAWLAANNGGRPEREDIGTLADNWSSSSPPAFFACSPHRIEHVVILIADGYHEEHAIAALDLLPQWVEWCIERSALTGEPAERARQAARNNRWEGTDDRELRRPE